MIKTSKIPMLILTTTLAFQFNTALADSTNLSGKEPEFTNNTSRCHEIQTDAAPKFRHLRFDDFQMKIPYNSSWRAYGKKFPAAKFLTTTHRIKDIYFGKPKFRMDIDCEITDFNRDYRTAIEPLWNVNLKENPFQTIRKETIGNKEVYIVTHTGDTDCPGEDAYIIHNDKALIFSKECENLDKESRKIIKSIKLLPGKKSSEKSH